MEQLNESGNQDQDSSVLPAGFKFADRSLGPSRAIRLLQRAKPFLPIALGFLVVLQLLYSIYKFWEYGNKLDQLQATQMAHEEYLKSFVKGELPLQCMEFGEDGICKASRSIIPYILEQLKLLTEVQE